MNVIFVEPAFPANQREFVRGLVSVGARVVAIGESSREALPPELQESLLDYIQVPSVCDEGALTRAVQRVQQRMPVARMEATVEAHIMSVARVREACSIPGVSVHTSWLCRDKPAMKQALREAGIPCAASLGSDDPREIRQFAGQTGYPLIAKPRSGAGATGTSRIDNEDELDQVLRQAGLGSGGSLAIEEFVDGHEAFFDTISVHGQVVHEFITHYYPNVLEAMRNRWISPQFITTNRIDTAPDYEEVRQMGRRVNQALQIGTSATHMEWFFGSRGLRFSEIGCRPPGVRAWDLYNVANDLDLYREWAMAVCHGRADRSASRRYSAGIIALRPSRDGRISGYQGLDEIERRFGEWLIDWYIPDPGTPTQPVEAGYMANAWIRMKHPDFDQLRRMLDQTGQTVRVLAS